MLDIQCSDYILNNKTLRTFSNVSYELNTTSNRIKYNLTSEIFVKKRSMLYVEVKEFIEHFSIPIALSSINDLKIFDKNLNKFEIIGNSTHKYGLCIKALVKRFYYENSTQFSFNITDYINILNIIVTFKDNYNVSIRNDIFTLNIGIFLF